MTVAIDYIAVRDGVSVEWLNEVQRQTPSLRHIRR